MDKDKAVKVLNSLVTINNDRIEGYETASKETTEQDLLDLFSRFLDTSRRIKQELEAEVTKMGGEPSEHTKITGKFFRVWMDVKVALTKKDRKAILSSCEFGEDNALATYEDAIEDDMEHLTPAQQTMVKNQYEALKKDHDKVKSMLESLETAA